MTEAPYAGYARFEVDTAQWRVTAYRNGSRLVDSTLTGSAYNPAVVGTVNPALRAAQEIWRGAGLATVGTFSELSTPQELDYTISLAPTR